jgi:hypothetical protein
MPHPSVPRIDGEGTYKQDGEHPSITLTGPRLGGSMHDYTSWQCTKCRCMPSTSARHHRGRPKYCRRRLKQHLAHRQTLQKNLAGAPRLLQGFWGYTRGCASAPPRNSTTSRREEHPIRKRQPLQDPNGYHHRGSGATVGDSPRGPLNNQGKSHFLSHITQTNSQNITHSHGPVARAHGPGGLSGPPEQTTPTTLGRNSASLEGHNTALTKFCLARGLDAPSSEVPPRASAGHPLG